MGNIIDGKLSDLLMMETECDEYIYAVVPMTHNKDIMEVISFDRDAYKEAMEYMDAPFYDTVEEALIAYRKKYKNAFNEKIELFNKDEWEMFKRNPVYRIIIGKINCANNLLDILAASK